ncbi:MAG: hypothetical protein BKP49_03640 [Treponema sp. CETP13]|nr:MAG: hypothetical protein BKP49_03640 [Treponema sp. CETP13]
MKKFITYIALIFSGFVCISFVIPFFCALSPLWNPDKLGFIVHSTLSFRLIVRATIFTIEVAVGSTLIAIIIGVPTAFFVAKRRFFGKKLLKTMSAVPLCIPSLLIALGFVIVFGINGSLNRFVKYIFGLDSAPITFLYSFWGIIIAQGFYNFPLIMRTVSEAWGQLPEEEANAARLLGAGEGRVFRTVTIYQLFPSIASSSVLVFLFCFFSFIIVLLFGSVGGTTLEVSIYQSARTSLDFRTAAVLALIETTVAMFIIFLYGKLETKAARNTGIRCPANKYDVPSIGHTSTISWGDPKKIQYGEIIAFVLLAVLVAFCFFMPLFSIFLNAFVIKTGESFHALISIKNFVTLFERHSFWLSLLHTLETAFFTGCLSVLTGLVFALFSRRIDPYNAKRILKIVPLLPMAVSSVIMGFGITMFVPQGKPFMLIFAQTALYWPFAFKQISTALNRIPEITLEAARLLSRESTDVFFKVEIPLVRRSILSAFGFCFAISCGDATLPLVLAIPRYETLALLTYRLAGSYRFSEACACGCILGLLTAGVFAFSDFIEKRGQNARLS